MTSSPLMRQVSQCFGNRLQGDLHAQSIVEDDVLDSKVNEVDSVMDGKRNNGRVVVGEDGRDATVEGLQGGSAFWLGPGSKGG
jgi:hypothetical protein